MGPASKNVGEHYSIVHSIVQNTVKKGLKIFSPHISASPDHPRENDPGGYRIRCLSMDPQLAEICRENFSYCSTVAYCYTVEYVELK